MILGLGDWVQHLKELNTSPDCHIPYISRRFPASVKIIVIYFPSLLDCTRSKVIKSNNVIKMSPTADDQSSRIRYILTAALDNPSLSTDTADTAVKRLNQLCPETRDKQEIESFLWTLWTVLLGLVKETPADDEKMNFLVTFASELKASENGSVKIWGETSQLWGDLPLLGAVVREEWNCKLRMLMHGIMLIKAESEPFSRWIK